MEWFNIMKAGKGERLEHRTVKNNVGDRNMEGNQEAVQEKTEEGLSGGRFGVRGLRQGLIWLVLLLILVNIAGFCLLCSTWRRLNRLEENGGEKTPVDIHVSEGELPRLSWAGKTWCSYGDSITQEASWQDYVTEYFGFAKHYNRGIGSSTFAKNNQTWYANPDGSYNSRFGFAGVTEAPEGTTEHEGYLCSSDRIDVSVPEDADLILIMGGTNDMGSNVPLGDLTVPFDETTFKGAVAATVVKIQEKVPGAVVALASPLSGRGPEPVEGSSLPDNRDVEEFMVNELGLTTEDYRDAMEEVAQALSIPFIDVYGTTGINQWNRSQYIRDVVHPSERGGMAVARSVIGGLEQIKPNMISLFSAARDQVPVGYTMLKELPDGLSVQLNRIQWERSEAEGRILLTGQLPEELDSGVFSITVSDPAYFQQIGLELSEDGENWQQLQAGVHYEYWADTLWANFSPMKIRYIRLSHPGDVGEECVFRFGFYQEEDVAGSFDCGSMIRKLSASVNGDQVKNMVDHDLDTRWTSGLAQTEGVWVMAELTEDCMLDGVRMELSDSIGDFPWALRIETSEDGKTWTEQTAVSEDQIDFQFEPVRCGYLRLVLGEIPEGVMANWSIHELVLFGSEESNG